MNIYALKKDFFNAKVNGDVAYDKADIDTFSLFRLGLFR